MSVMYGNIHTNFMLAWLLRPHMVCVQCVAMFQTET